MTPTHPTDGTPIPSSAPVNNDNDGKTKAPKNTDTYPANIPPPDAKYYTTPAPEVKEVKDTPNTEAEPPVPGQEDIEKKLSPPPAVTQDDKSTVIDGPPTKTDTHDPVGKKKSKRKDKDA